MKTEETVKKENLSEDELSRVSGGAFESNGYREEDTELDKVIENKEIIEKEFR